MNIKKFIAVFTAFITIILAGCSSSGPGVSTDDPVKAFDQTKRKYERGDYVEAIEDFSFMKIRFPGTEVSDKVQYYLAMSYYRQQEYLLAAYEFDVFLKNYPLSELAPDAKYMIGATYYELSPKFSLDQEFTKESLSELLSFIEIYPQHKNVADAEAKVKTLRNKLAYKELYIADNYMKTNNYKAAALYYQTVYDNYIDSDWADDAMVGQAEAYLNGRRYDDARKVLDKFYKLFPKSDLKSRADRLGSRITEGQSQK